MNIGPITSRGRFATAFVLGLASPLAALLAQTAPTSPVNQSDKDEIVELSPFTVTAESSQTGYAARQTLAATRVRTDLKDVGAAVDVLTESFLNDTGALDVRDALRSMANMSNYEGAPDLNDSINNSSWFTFPFYSRGFAAGYLSSPMIDFFPFDFVPIDRYNTENLSFLRGPNAILFGIGSPGGNISSSYKRPNLSRDRYTVAATFDTYSSQRYELDVNQTILKNRLAIRIAAVDQNQHKFKAPSLEERKAVYGAITFKPFDKTTITINAEDGQRTFLWLPTSVIADSYTPWVLAGRPTVNFLTGKGQTAPGKGNYTRSITSGLGLAYGGNNLVYIEGSRQPIQNWINMARGAGWDANQGVPTFDRSALAGISLNENNNTLRTPDGREWELDLTANYWGDVNRHKTYYRMKSIFIEQNLAPGLNLELAANNSAMQYQWNAFANARPILRVDPNELLPDGTPNPYVGMPYIETSRQQIHREKHLLNNKRATLSYELDLEHKKIFRNIGLGRYNLLGLWEDQKKDTWLAVGRTVNTTPLAGFPTNMSATNNSIVRRYYLQPGESRFDAQGPGAIQDLDGASLGTGINIATVQAADEPPRHSIKKVTSKVGALQAHLWQANSGYYHFVGLYGARRDTVFERAMSFTRGPNGAYAGDFKDFDSAIQTGVWNPSREYSVSTKSYSLIFRPIEAVSLFYNYSDVFSSGDPNFRDVNGNATRPTYGDTKDYGVKISLLKDRLNLTVTQFKTVQFDQTFQSTSPMVLNPNRIWESIPGRSNRMLSTFRAYRDDASKGTEITLTATLNNWDIRLSGGHQKTQISKYADEVQAYMDANAAEWQQNAALPLLNPTDTLITVGDVIADTNRYMKDLRAIIGRRALNIPEYNAALNATYAFKNTDRWWKGIRAGAGVRWGESVAVGYARTATGLLDLSHPYNGADSFNIDLNASYSRKLFHDKIHWEIYANVFNVLNQDSVTPRTKIDTGDANHSPMTVETYLPTPRWFQIRSTFTF